MLALACAVGGVAFAQNNVDPEVEIDRRVALRVEALRLDGAGESWVRRLVDASRDAIGGDEYVDGAAYARIAWVEGAERVRSGERDELPMEAAYNEGVALMRLGAVEAAAGRFRTVRAMPASDGFERRLVRDAAYNLGLLRLSEADAAVSSRVDSRDPLAGLVLGDPDEGWARYDELIDELMAGYASAAAYFEEVLRDEPDDVEAARNLRIAHLRMGELQRRRYEAWREREDLAAQIVRPDEAMTELQSLADRQDGEASASRSLEEAVESGEAEAGPAARGAIAGQRPLTADTDELREGVVRTTELLRGRLRETLPPMVMEQLTPLYEEAGLGLRDAVDGQRWSVFEFANEDLGEGAALQEQARDDLLAVLEKLQTRTPPPPQRGEEGDDQQQNPEDSDEEGDPEEADDSQEDFQEVLHAREREARIREILEREREDLERVRQFQRRRTGGAERDW